MESLQQAAGERVPVATSDPPRRGRLGRNLLALGAGQMFTWTMSLAWTLVVPRIIGPGGLGLIVEAIAVAGILQIVLGMGTTAYVVREIVVARSRLSELVATAAALRLLLAPLFAVAVAVYAHLAHYGGRGTLVLYLVAGATLLTMIAEPVQGALQAIEEMQYLALGDAINKSAQGLLGIALALIGYGVVGFAGCLLATSALVLALSIRWVRRFEPLVLRTSRQRIAAMARGSAAYWTGGLFFTIYLWIDTAMLSLMTNATVVGWYGVATELFQTMMIVAVMASTAWLPRLVSAFERSRSELIAQARVPLELVLSAALPIAAVVAFAAPPAVRLVYGDGYRHASTPLIILGCCLAPMYVNIILAQVCVAAKKQTTWTWMMAGATVFNPTVNAILIPLTQHHWHNGAIGAAISLLLTELAIVAAALRVIGTEVFSRSGVLRLARIALACAGAVGAAVASRALGSAASIAIGVAALATLAVALRTVSRAELALARGQLAAASSGLPGPLRRRLAFLRAP
jgi:O-antigen/teichoic acid export membrane protein